MSIFAVYYNGFRKSVRSIRTIVLLWIVSLAGSLLVVAPLERNIERLLDGSIGPELLYDGFDIDIFADIMHAITPALASFSITFFLVSAIIFLVNTFLTAGLFRVIAGSWKKPYKSSTFLKGADRGFGGFLFVAIAAAVMIFIMFIIVFLLPLVIAVVAGAGYTFLMLAGTLLAVLLFMLIPVVLLTADWARVFLTADKHLGPYRALIDGFGSLRRRFLRNWLMMFIILAISILVGVFSMRIVTYSKLSSGAGLILLLLVSQLFVFLKIWIKVIRYGSVTAMAESDKKS
jgi:hypothetical protein